MPTEHQAKLLKPLSVPPISGQPSTRLSLATGYFRVAGWLTLGALACASLVALIFRPAALVTALTSNPFGLTAAAATGVGLLWTGRELRRRSVTGWYSALATAVLPLIPSAFGKPITWPALTMSALGILLLLSIRDELE